MKNVSILLFIAFGISVFSQDCKDDWDAFMEVQTQEFRNIEKSPLASKDFAVFESLDYFEYNEDYCVEAQFERTPNEEPIILETSTDRKLTLVKYGWLHFEINDVKQSLAVYQDPKDKDSEQFADYLFLPFGDDTNGMTTYGAGRYIDFSIPDTDVVQLDFNQSYNPLCAYNHKYSCPRPPSENMLTIEINAGVKGVNLKDSKGINSH